MIFTILPAILLTVGKLVELGFGIEIKLAMSCRQSRIVLPYPTPALCLSNQIGAAVAAGLCALWAMPKHILQG